MRVLVVDTALGLCTAGVCEVDGARARQLGPDFTMQRFFDEVTAAGMIPASLIYWELTGDDRMIKDLIPFVLVILACLMVITYVPAISLTLRDIVYAK